MVALTVARVREVLKYNPETGSFFRNGKKVRVRPNAGGYLRITIDGVTEYCHILAWVIMTGTWPKHDVDHEDRNKLNNKWSNLRAATSTQNKANTALSARNTSGYKGVSWNRKRSKWFASIRIHGKTKGLGYHDNPKSAHEAYVREARRLFGEFACSG